MERKTGRTVEEESALPKSIYFSDRYFRKKRLYSQIEQIIWIHRLKPNRVLEIGPGNGFVSTFLRLAGISVDTVDVNRNLSPTYCCSVLEMCKAGIAADYDVVLCAEVLEHLPFADFSAALQALSRHTRRYVVMTLPRCQRILFAFNFSLKLFKMKQRFGRLLLTGRSRKIGRDHQWEINSSKDTKLKQIKNKICDLFIIHSDIIFDYQPYHHFFLLEKKPDSLHV